MSPSDRVDPSVQVGALRLRNPVITAAGTFGYGVEFARLVDLNKLGGIVTKGISREPIEGAPAPRVCETASGMLNAIGLQNIGVEAFVKTKLPVLQKYNTPVFVNVFGYCIEDYLEVIHRLEDADISGHQVSAVASKSQGAAQARRIEHRSRWPGLNHAHRVAVSAPNEQRLFD